MNSLFVAKGQTIAVTLGYALAMAFGVSLLYVIESGFGVPGIVAFAILGAAMCGLFSESVFSVAVEERECSFALLASAGSSRRDLCWRIVRAAAVTALIGIVSGGIVTVAIWCMSPHISVGNPVEWDALWQSTAFCAVAVLCGAVGGAWFAAGAIGRRDDTCRMQRGNAPLSAGLPITFVLAVPLYLFVGAFLGYAAVTTMNSSGYSSELSGTWVWIILAFLLLLIALTDVFVCSVDSARQVGDFTPRRFFTFAKPLLLYYSVGAFVLVEITYAFICVYGHGNFLLLAVIPCVLLFVLLLLVVIVLLGAIKCAGSAKFVPGAGNTVDKSSGLVVSETGCGSRAKKALRRRTFRRVGCAIAFVVLVAVVLIAFFVPSLWGLHLPLFRDPALVLHVDQKSGDVIFAELEPGNEDAGFGTVRDFEGNVYSCQIALLQSRHPDGFTQDGLFAPKEERRLKPGDIVELVGDRNNGYGVIAVYPNVYPTINEIKIIGEAPDSTMESYADELRKYGEETSDKKGSNTEIRTIPNEELISDAARWYFRQLDEITAEFGNERVAYWLNYELSDSSEGLRECMRNWAGYYTSTEERKRELDSVIEAKIRELENEE